MAEIVNLRRVRKRKERDDRDKKSDNNRKAHGLSKFNKRANEEARLKREKVLDGHRLDNGPND